MATPPRPPFWTLEAGAISICQPARWHMFATDGYWDSVMPVSWRHTRAIPLLLATRHISLKCNRKEAIFQEATFKGPGWSASPTRTPRRPLRVALLPPATLLGWALMVPPATWRHFFQICFLRLSEGALPCLGWDAQIEIGMSPAVTVRLHRLQRYLGYCKTFPDLLVQIVMQLGLVSMSCDPAQARFWNSATLCSHRSLTTAWEAWTALAANPCLGIGGTDWRPCARWRWCFRL